jgi:hypothetical protein
MDRKVVEAKVDEVLSAKIKQNANARKNRSTPSGSKTPSLADTSPFAGFGAGSIPDFSAISGLDGGKLPLKIRVMTKLASLATHPQIARFLKKKWWPLWIIVGILLSGFIVIALCVFIIWKFIMSIVGAYTGMFKKN